MHHEYRALETRSACSPHRAPSIDFVPLSLTLSLSSFCTVQNLFFGISVPHSFLYALFILYSTPPSVFLLFLDPLCGMRQSWHAVREQSLNYLALAFWSSASFPWPSCFVCLLLFDGAWRDCSLFIPLEGHDGPLLTSHPLKDLTLHLIVPNIQLPAICISTKWSTQIYGALAGVQAMFDRFWEE